MTHLPILTEVSNDELSEDLVDYFAALAGNYPDGNVPGLYRLLAHCPAVVRPVHLLAKCLFSETGLDPELRQVVILRTVWLERCPHAWAQHVMMSSAAGLDDDKVTAVQSWTSSDRFSADERCALELVDSIADDGPRRPLTADTVERLGPSTTVAVEMLVGFFVMVSRLLNSAELGVADAGHVRISTNERGPTS